MFCIAMDGVLGTVYMAMAVGAHVSEANGVADAYVPEWNVSGGDSHDESWGSRCHLTQQFVLPPWLQSEGRAITSLHSR
jgi:hypothetical protein